MTPLLMSVQCCIAVLLCPSATAFKMRKQRLTEVPHHLIPREDTTIDLNGNEISSLGRNEFSDYTELEMLILSANKIVVCDALAFSGNSKLWLLQLSDNKLTEMPDLAAVKHSLMELQLGANRITRVSRERLDLPRLRLLQLHQNDLEELPDFSLVGTNTTEMKKVRLSKITPPPTNEAILTLCRFEMVTWRRLESYVPLLGCDQASLIELKLPLNGYNDDTDFYNLTYLAPISSFVNLSLMNNDFTVFPDLPHTIRQKLKVLDLSQCDIVSVPDNAIQSYSLQYLDLSENRLLTVPPALFAHTENLILSNNPTFINWTSQLWTPVFCNEQYFSLRYLGLYDTLLRPEVFPEINSEICGRSDENIIDIEMKVSNFEQGYKLYHLSVLCTRYIHELRRSCSAVVVCTRCIHFFPHRSHVMICTWYIHDFRRSCPATVVCTRCMHLFFVTFRRSYSVIVVYIECTQDFRSYHVTVVRTGCIYDFRSYHVSVVCTGCIYGFRSYHVSVVCTGCIYGFRSYHVSVVCTGCIYGFRSYHVSVVCTGCIYGFRSYHVSVVCTGCIYGFRSYHVTVAFTGCIPCSNLVE